MPYTVKKLTFYAPRTGTGTGVLCVSDGRAKGTDTGVVSAILSDRSRSKMVVFVWGNNSERQVHGFWNRCGLH